MSCFGETGPCAWMPSTVKAEAGRALHVGQAALQLPREAREGGGRRRREKG